MKSLCSRLSIVLLGLVFSKAIVSPSAAQIIPDGTTNTAIDSTDRGIGIEKGNRAGDNLFHSFREFSVPNGSEVFFNNPNDIINIFSRVTGGNISNIDGLLKVNGDANLFLINPAGIVFGEGASLDIGGSFFASTAESIVFADNIEFSAVDTDNEPLLTISQPLGLNFANNPGNIALERSNLEVDNGSSLALFGGNINVNAGQISAPGGRVELGSLSQAGQIEFDNLAFDSVSFPASLTRGDITLTNGTNILVRSAGGGSIRVNANNLELSGGELGASYLKAGIASESNSPEAQAGDIEIDTTGDIILRQRSNIANTVEVSGVGNAGNIDINTTNLFLRESSLINAGTSGQGNSGTIEINALDTVLAEGADNIQIKVPREIGGIGAVLTPSGSGESGTIDITTDNLMLRKGAGIFSSTIGSGNAGKISIEARDRIAIDGEIQLGFNSGIFSRVLLNAKGNSEGINIKTNNLSLIRGGVVDASVATSGEGQGMAGVINVNVSDTISIDGEDLEGKPSGIFSRVESAQISNSGGIKIDTGNLLLTNGGVVNASTFGRGDAGAIAIKATDTISADGELSNGIGSGVYSIVSATGEGNAGGININTNELLLSVRGEISVENLGQGNAGNLNLKANSLSLTNASLFASTPIGNGGNITLQIAENITLRDRSTISAQALADANGGNINIDAEFIIAIDNNNNGIIASADRGVGGNIDIATNSLFGFSQTALSNTNKIDASSQFGLDGAIAINELDLNPAEALEELPTEIIDLTKLIAQNLCQQEKGSEFVFTGKGGVASSPLETRDGEIHEVNLVPPANDSEDNATVVKGAETFAQINTKPEITEAQGWIVNDRGNLELVAKKTDLNNYFQPKSDRLCQSH